MKNPSAPKRATPKPAPKLAQPGKQPPPAKLVNDGGKPAAGKHVPSSIPGGGASDYSKGVGSNVTPAKGVPASKSSDVMDAPPYPGPMGMGPGGGQYGC